MVRSSAPPFAHLVEMLDIEPVNEVLVVRVVMQHGDDSRRVEQKDHAAGNHQDDTDRRHRDERPHVEQGKQDGEPERQYEGDQARPIAAVHSVNPFVKRHQARLLAYTRIHIPSLWRWVLNWWQTICLRGISVKVNTMSSRRCAAAQQTFDALQTDG